MLNWKTLGALFLMGSVLSAAGCKSAPELTSAQALALVQAKYDQTPAVGVNILVNAQATPRPGSSATAVSAIPWRTISRCTSADCAPIASRIPISRVRRLTEWLMTP